MLKHKPVRKPRQDIRTLPTYTIPEAAAFLAIVPRTLFSWYEGDEPILRASGKYGSIHLLSYLDIEEAYRVYLLREKYQFNFCESRCATLAGCSVRNIHFSVPTQ